MRRLRPLFDPDPGWLFLIAGLAMVCAAVILPAQRQLHDLDEQVNALQAEEQTTLARLKAHAAFRDLLAQEDPTLMARLAASQLNMIRRGERAVLIATTGDAPLTDWVDATVKPIKAETTPYPDSRLVELVTGDKREWIIAASAFCIFAGLVLGPSREDRRRRRAIDAEEASDDLELTGEAAAAVAIAIPDEDLDAAEFDADDFDEDDEVEAEFSDDDFDDADEELLDAEEALMDDEDADEEDADAVMLAGRDEDEDGVDGDAFADDEDEDENEEWEEEDDEEWEESEDEDEDGEWEDEEDDDYEDGDELEEDEDDEAGDEESADDDDESDDEEEWDEDEDEDEGYEDDDAWEDDEEEDDEEESDGEDELSWESDEEEQSEDVDESTRSRIVSVSASREEDVAGSLMDDPAAVTPEVEIVRRVPSVAAPRDDRPEPPAGMLF